jgi:hypothetical protein
MTINLIKKSSDLLARRVKDADFKKMGAVPSSPYFKEKRDCPLFRIMNKVSADCMNNSGEKIQS